ncbi:MAG: DegT/DnrJ/EryC1/StrS family aminotransferase [Acidimicrobiales bacterium]
MTTPLPLIDVQAQRAVIGDEIDARMAAVVEHGKFIMGPEVAEFEAAVAAFVGVDGLHAIGCANGTDALVLALQALGLQPGDGVICPSFTFVATAEAVALLGGRPVFADVGEGGFNLSAESVRRAAKEAEAAGIPIAGICPVDLFGVPADYDGLSTLADELGCWILADAAQSFGGSQGGRRVGALARVTTTSFFPAKPLGCYGDGGMVFTTDPALAELLESLRVHGKGTEKYDNVRIGQNSRLDTLQAAVLLPKLGVLGDEIERRNAVASRYGAALADYVATPSVDDGSVSAWAQYTVITDRRAELQAGLSAAGIGCAVYYPTPLHRQTGYRHFHLDGQPLVRTERLCEQVLSLPMHPYLTEDETGRVIAVVTRTLG